MMAPGFGGAIAVAERRGREVAEERARQLEDVARAAGLAAGRDGGEVTITGPGVLDDPALRWAGGMLR